MVSTMVLSNLANPAATPLSCSLKGALVMASFDITHQMNEALLLRTIHGLVCSVEVRNHDDPETHSAHPSILLDLGRTSTDRRRLSCWQRYSGHGEDEAGTCRLQFSGDRACCDMATLSVLDARSPQRTRQTLVPLQLLLMSWP